MRVQVDVVGFTMVTGDTILNADFHYRRVAEKGPVKILWADCQRRKLRVRRWRTKAPLFHVLDFVVRNEALCDTVCGFLPPIVFTAAVLFLVCK